MEAPQKIKATASRIDRIISAIIVDSPHPDMYVSMFSCAYKVRSIFDFNLVV